MREIMRRIGKWTPVRTPLKDRPQYYSRPGIIVLGHYETACGGCDAIGSAREVYDITANMLLVDSKRVLLMEGLLLSEDVKWSSQMPALKVVFLTTPLEQCLAQIAKRRAEAGNDKPVNPKNTENRVRTIERARVRLLEKGVLCRRASPEQAPNIVMGWLGYTRASNGKWTKNNPG
jgi:hypothetical protein